MNTTASYDKLLGHQVLDDELDRTSSSLVIDFKCGYQIIAVAKFKLSQTIL